MTSISSAKWKADENFPNNCGICLDDFIDRVELLGHTVGSSKHYFHRDCFVTWIKEKENCPSCRGNLSLKDEQRREWAVPRRVDHTAMPRLGHISMLPFLMGQMSFERSVSRAPLSMIGMHIMISPSFVFIAIHRYPISSALHNSHSNLIRNSHYNRMNDRLAPSCSGDLSRREEIRFGSSVASDIRNQLQRENLIRNSASIKEGPDSPVHSDETPRRVHSVQELLQNRSDPPPEEDLYAPFSWEQPFGPPQPLFEPPLDYEFSWERPFGEPGPRYLECEKIFK